MMSPEEVELLDIWNEEFEGIQLDWSEMESLLQDEGSDNKEENCNDSGHKYMVQLSCSL